MNKGKKWTDEHIVMLRKCASENMDISDIAEQMGRTVGSIEAKMEQLSIFYPNTLSAEQTELINRTLDDLASTLGTDRCKLVSIISRLNANKKAGAEPKLALEVPVLKPVLKPVVAPAPAPSSVAPSTALAPVPASVELEPLNEDQAIAFDLFQTGQSLCITGPAGTGKSHLLKHITKHCMDNGIEFAITAMTGAAASLISGQTLHKWSGLGLIDKSIESCVGMIKGNESVTKRWLSTKVLVIDEISMMWAELFERLDKIAQKARNNTSFYGGIQMIFCGDFAQLPPIGHTDFAFESKVWQENITTVYLAQVMRQDQPQFIKMLQEVRLGIVTPETKKLLQSRVVKNIEQATTHVELDDGSMIPIKPTMLYPFRKDVDKINGDELTALKQAGNKTITYTAVDKKYDYKTRTTGPASRDDTSAIEERSPRVIELAVNALVMLTTNIDTEAGLVNGSRGQILEFKDGYPMVQFSNGAFEHIKPVQFESVINSGIVRRTQIPLALAWALTIHKCQGATLDGVVTDLRGAFCDAQSYVTLSRVKSLETLFLLGIDLSKIRCNPKVKEYYDGLEHGETYSKTEVFAAEEEPDMGNCMI